MEKHWIYEVNVEVPTEWIGIFEGWISPHAQAVVKTGCFVSAQAYRDTSKAGTYRIQYYALDRTFIERYLSEFAPTLRKDAQARFENSLRFTRQVLEPV